MSVEMNQALAGIEEPMLDPCRTFGGKRPLDKAMLTTSQKALG